MKRIDYTNYKKPTDFMKFLQGENRIRIISTGTLGFQHSMKTANRYINLGICTEDENCEHCNKGYEPKQVWKWLVYDHSDSRVKILDAGPMLGNQICEIASVSGDPQEYDLLITKSGEGFKTQYICTKAKEDKEIPEEERKSFEFKKKRLINKFLVKKERTANDKK